MSDIATSDTATTVGPYDCRDTFAATPPVSAETDPRAVVVVNFSVGSSNRGGFTQTFPSRPVNLGSGLRGMTDRLISARRAAGFRRRECRDGYSRRTRPNCCRTARI